MEVKGMQDIDFVVADCTHIFRRGKVQDFSESVSKISASI